MVPTSASISDHSARREATGCPPGVRWLVLRDVDIPIAPACNASVSSRCIAARSSGEAACSKARAPITNVRSAEWPT